LILVHVMPWFEAKPFSGGWGWHWTMGHFDPDRTDPTGRRSIASHYYPLIGPYDSADRDVIEYHTLLMKAAGIDGVIADWYGTSDVNDYGQIHRRTCLLFQAVERAGLKFAVCYEDRTLKAIVERRHLPAGGAVEQARADLRFCAENWFKNPGYVSWQGQPLLLVFGPDHLSEPQWTAVFSGMRPPPAFVSLHERRAPAIGSFAWPPMWASKQGMLDEQGLDEYLDRFSKQDGLKIGGVFPGFHDIYQQAGVQPSHGFLDARDGKTFQHTLEKALALETPFIQIATWNDFGEGTNIEPSRESDYRDLEAIQSARRRLSPESFRYQPSDLRLPLRIHQLRKTVARSSPPWRQLDAAAASLRAGDGPAAEREIHELERAGPSSQPGSR
jgi:hypothetical protein